MPRTTTPTLGAFYLEHFRPLQASRRATGTVANYDSHMRNWLAEFAEVRLRDITPQMIDLWWIKNDNGHRVGRRGAYTTLSGIMRLAMKYGMTYEPGRSPCLVEGWSTDYSNKPKTYTLDDFREVRGWLPQPLRAPVTLVFAATLRIGEVCGLNLGDWNPDTKELTVSRSYTNGRELKSTKSGRVKVLVPLAPGIEVLERLRIPKSRAWESVPMFVGEGRKRLHPGVLRQNWDRARRLAGRPEMRLYDTRHVSVTFQGEAGLPVHVIAARAGHARITTTERYLHSAADRSASDAALVNAHLGDRLGE